MKPETLAAQALHAIDRETGAIVPPVHFATTYARDEHYATRGPMYSRDDNPIHCDPDFARTTHFGATVAHGMFLYALLAAQMRRSHR